MKAVAIVSGWISYTDETGERRFIPNGTRILSGRRRATWWTDDDLNLQRNRALRSYLEAI